MLPKPRPTFHLGLATGSNQSFFFILLSYLPFFEPFGMYCPLTIDQIHQTEKLQFRTAAESSDLSTKGFVEFLWIALGEIYQS